MGTTKPRDVFVTGATGYLGGALIPELLRRGHKVTGLVRAGSESKLPPGCKAVVGNPLDRATFIDRIKPADTFVQLVGVPHPSPRKADQFRTIDFVSARESTLAASAAGIRHFVYLSVAMPSPVMKDYVAVRADCETRLRASGLNATFIRPLYVLGPGHKWPYLLLPFFWLFEKIPSQREAALRLKPVTLKQTVLALIDAIENPANGIRILEAPEIRAMEK